MLSLFTSPTAAAKGSSDNSSLERKTEVAAPIFSSPAISRGGYSGRKIGKPQKGTMVSMPKSIVPTLPTSIKFTHTFRFSATAGLSQNVTGTNLFGMCGGIVSNTAGTVFSPWCSSVRVRRVTIYEAPGAVGSVAANSSLEWTALTTNNPDEVFSTSTIPYDRPSKIVSRPPKNSLAAFWINSLSTLTVIYFIVTLGAGSILDIEVDAILANNLGTNLISQTVTASSGVNYYRNLAATLTAVGVPPL